MGKTKLEYFRIHTRIFDSSRNRNKIKEEWNEREGEGKQGKLFVLNEREKNWTIQCMVESATELFVHSFNTFGATAAAAVRFLFLSPKLTFFSLSLYLSLNSKTAQSAFVSDFSLSLFLSLSISFFCSHI